MKNLNNEKKNKRSDFIFKKAIKLSENYKLQMTR